MRTEKLHGLDLTNVSSFKNATRSGKSYCAVGVDSGDGKWADPHRVKFVLGTVVAGEDQVVDLEVSLDTGGICTEETFVNLELTSVSDGKIVSNVGDVD